MSSAIASERQLAEGLGAGVSIHPATQAIGAEVRGLDLGRRPFEQGADALLAALWRYHVLFFRAQGLDDEAHLALAEALGEPMVHPFERAMGREHPIHTIIDKPEDVPDRAGWHTDDSYLEEPPAYAVLRCEVAPEFGGDTSWSNMALAYDQLSAEMRHFLDGLIGFHQTDGGLLDYVREHVPEDRIDRVLTEIGVGARHPVVRTHPGSGRRALFFEPNFMRSIEELSDRESQFVCGLLAAQTEQVSLQCRFRWQAGDVVLWDERTTQHIGAADHAGQLRVLKRCTIRGERPQ